MIQLKKVHPLQLKGDRVVLRPIEESDLDDVQNLWRDVNVMRHVGFPKGLPKSNEEMQQWYASLYDHIDVAEKDYLLAVTDLAGRYLGETKIGRRESDNTSHPDVKLLPIYWGKGYAKEVFSLIIDFTFEHLLVDYVKVTPSVLNERAIRLYHSLGFNVEGPLKTWNPPDSLKHVAQAVEYQTMLLSKTDYRR